VDSLPSGTVTFLFTDIEGSTQRWERAPDAMAKALARHDALLRAVIVAQGGAVFKTVGDAFCAAFRAAPNAAAAALAAQRALAAEPWAGVEPLRVRMALHTGLAEERDQDYFGPPLNRVARLLAAGHGGQVLVSSSSFELLRDQLPSDVSLRDLGEHRLKDLGRPEHIYQLAAPDLPADFPPLKAASVRLSHLPVRREPPIGRDADARALRALVLRSDVALVTLTGPGGIGKTTLATCVAAELGDAFADGVVFVDLAPLTDPAHVAPAIAQALDLHEQGAQPLVDLLRDHLRDRRFLLVLDNFEQVADAAALVADLLRAAPHLKVLVTSRALLNLRDEHEFPVPPLALPTQPGQSRPMTLANLGASPAVQVLVQRAAQARPGFALTAENAPAVADIVTRLDGLPLALELAAARLRMLTPQALLGHLDSRLKLLTAGPRDLPARHQTLRAAIASSYDLLDPAEQALFRRMGVFLGGAGYAAVEAVCAGWAGGPATDAFEVLDRLQSLAGKSLIRQQGASEDEPRFFMLETIREYAVEQLEAAGEADEAGHRHLDYYSGVAQRTFYFGPFQRAVWDIAQQDHANFRAALRRAVEEGDNEAELTLAGWMSFFWNQHGHLFEDVAALEAALRRAPEGASTRAAARALLGLAGLYFFRGDLAACTPYFARALDALVATGDLVNAAMAHSVFGMIVQFHGDAQRARTLVAQGLALAKQTGDDSLIGGVLGNQGHVLLLQGDYAGARASLEGSIVGGRRGGDLWVQAEARATLGDVARCEGDYARAGELYEQALPLFAELDLPSELAAVRHNLAYARLGVGQVDEAERLFAMALRDQQAIGNPHGVAECLGGLAAVRAAQEQLETAARLFGAAAALRDSIGEVIWWPAERLDVERTHDRLIAALGPEAFAAAEAAGRSLDEAQAVSLALRE
jgi:predicted ATPase/class 3 adenylate cyclase